MKSKNCSNYFSSDAIYLKFWHKFQLYLQNWQIYGHLNVKIKMGMAGLIFEPRPPNFENLYNF